MGGPYSLDTCTLIWSMESPDRLSPRARRALKTGPLVLSVVTYFGRRGLFHPGVPHPFDRMLVAQAAAEDSFFSEAATESAGIRSRAPTTLLRPTRKQKEKEKCNPLSPRALTSSEECTPPTRLLTPSAHF